MTDQGEVLDERSGRILVCIRRLCEVKIIRFLISAFMETSALLKLTCGWHSMRNASRINAAQCVVQR